MAACSDTRASAFFKGFAGINARSVPGGRATEEKACQGCGGDGEKQDGEIEPQVGLYRQRVREAWWQ